jgi:hypothetical protein
LAVVATWRILISRIEDETAISSKCRAGEGLGDPGAGRFLEHVMREAGYDYRHRQRQANRQRPWMRQVHCTECLRNRNQQHRNDRVDNVTLFART